MAILAEPGFGEGGATPQLALTGYFSWLAMAQANLCHALFCPASAILAHAGRSVFCKNLEVVDLELGCYLLSGQFISQLSSRFSALGWLAGVISCHLCYVSGGLVSQLSCVFAIFLWQVWSAGRSCCT